MSPKFSAIPFIVYPIKDMQRAKAFYEGVLGLKECFKWEEEWLEYEIGDNAGVIALCTQLEGCTPGAKGAAAALETADFDGMVAHLRANGVKFIREPMDSSVCMFARFEDPEGNHFILHRKH